MFAVKRVIAVLGMASMGLLGFASPLFCQQDSVTTHVTIVVLPRTPQGPDLQTPDLQAEDIKMDVEKIGMDAKLDRIKTSQGEKTIYTLSQAL